MRSPRFSFLVLGILIVQVGRHVAVAAPAGPNFVETFEGDGSYNGGEHATENMSHEDWATHQFYHHDENRDGKVSLEEFTSHGLDKEEFEAHDKDKDGAFTKMEFDLWYLEDTQRHEARQQQVGHEGEDLQEGDEDELPIQKKKKKKKGKKKKAKKKGNQKNEVRISADEFVQVDKDNDGKVSAEELKEMGILDEEFVEFDADADKSFSREEWDKWFSADIANSLDGSSMSIDEDVQDAEAPTELQKEEFAEWDADKSGAVSLVEFTEAGGDKDEFAQFDLNKDGQLSQKEYYAWWKIHGADNGEPLDGAVDDL